MLSVDRFIVEFDKGLRTLFSQAHSARPYLNRGEINTREKRDKCGMSLD
jgi:hypothetical protein